MTYQQPEEPRRRSNPAPNQPYDPTQPYAPQQPGPYAPYQTGQQPQYGFRDGFIDGLRGPQAPRPNKHYLRNTLIAAGALVLVLIVLGAALSGSKTPADTASSSATTGATTTVQQSHAAAAPKTSKPAAPTVVFKASGSGDKNTANFTTSGDWAIAYTYNCSNFGMQGNFAVIVYNGSDLADAPVNELGTKGNDTSYEHGNPGSHYLNVTSECDWTVTVTSN